MSKTHVDDTSACPTCRERTLPPALAAAVERGGQAAVEVIKDRAAAEDEHRRAQLRDAAPNPTPLQPPRPHLDQVREAILGNKLEGERLRVTVLGLCDEIERGERQVAQLQKELKSRGEDFERTYDVYQAQLSGMAADGDRIAEERDQARTDLDIAKGELAGMARDGDVIARQLEIARGALEIVEPWASHKPCGCKLTTVEADPPRWECVDDCPYAAVTRALAATEGGPTPAEDPRLEVARAALNAICERGDHDDRCGVDDTLPTGPAWVCAPDCPWTAAAKALGALGKAVRKQPGLDVCAGCGSPRTAEEFDRALWCSTCLPKAKVAFGEEGGR